MRTKRKAGLDAIGERYDDTCAFTRAKAAAKKRRRDQENASGPALVPIVEAAKLLAQQK